MKRVLRSILRHFGYDLIGFKTYRGIPEPSIPWETDPDFLEIYKTIIPYTLLDKKRLYILYQAVKIANLLEGDFAEVGVYRGGTALLLSMLSVEEKNVHLFDTFDGMPETDNKVDLHTFGDFSDTSLISVKKLLGEFPKTLFYPGLFPETAQDLRDKVFNFVHVDVDIYSSVLSCCKFFYPRLVAGGIIIFDDYGFNSCPGAKNAVQDYCSAEGIKELYLPTGQAMLWKK